MATNSEKDICINCIKCKTEAAHIFHDSGDFCLECWQHSTHPDIRSYLVEIDR
jgi:hypothetical protein